MKRSKKNLISLCCLLSFLILLPSAAFASENISTNDNEKKLSATLIIKDSNSNEIRSWDISQDIVVQKGNLAMNRAVAMNLPGNTDINNIEFASVDINLYPYLVEANSSIVYGDKTVSYDIPVKTGLSYNRDYMEREQIAIYNVFGSTPTTGLYYADNWKVMWQHFYAGQGTTFYPNVSSWDYSVTPIYAAYNSNLPPYSLLDCDIHVTGMSGKDSVSVLFEVRDA